MTAIFDLMGSGAMFIDFGTTAVVPDPDPDPDPPTPVVPVSNQWRLVITNTSQGLGRAYGSEWLPLDENGVVISSGVTYSAPNGMAAGSEAAFHDSNTLGINAYNGPLPIVVNMTLASARTLHGLRWWSDSGGAYSTCPRAMRPEWNDGGVWKTHLQWSGYAFPWTGNSQAATFNASNAN